ncbi:hypothetical protein [Paenibacillus apiarius]|uniref:hypothetical protein n=1 Tax=Paenibacillus apiarius TaxID=46240 RepID=UPI003B3B6C09
MAKYIIKPGQVFERLEVIREAETVKGKRRVLCKCKCGEETTVNLYKLLNGITKSCGCLGRELASRPRAKDLTDQIFGWLTAKRRDGDERRNGSAVWICECKCGETIPVPARDLVDGNTKSCGCLLSSFTRSLKGHNEEHHYKDGAFVPLLTQKVQNNNKTGHRGISVRKGKNGSTKYVANISVKNKRHYLGIFDRLEDAVAARVTGEEQFYKPYLEDLNEQ